VADHHHLDSWQEDGFHFFVFQLRPPEGIPTGLADAPVAVFAMHPEIDIPVSAVVVTPKNGGVQAEVQDLREPEMVYTAPVASAYTAGTGSTQG
jgi:hypothetical protein